MISPVWSSKSAKSTFGMDHDQRVIIQFLENNGADTRQIAARLQAQFIEHAYQL
jgi:hypothetical protein